MFILISSIVSPDPPPLAGSELLTATDPFAKLNKEASIFAFGFISNFPVVVIVFELTLDLKPPPTKYFTVNVVFEGASP